MLLDIFLSIKRIILNRNYFEWDLMSYIDHLKFHEFAKDPGDYFNCLKVVNFDIIHNSSRGDLLMKFVKDHKTIFKTDFLAYLPELRLRFSLLHKEINVTICWYKEI